MTEMKAACPIYPEIDILPHGIEYHRYGQYRLLMCTDPALLAQYDRTTYMNKGFEDYLGASYTFSNRQIQLCEIGEKRPHFSRKCSSKNAYKTARPRVGII